MWTPIPEGTFGYPFQCLEGSMAPKEAPEEGFDPFPLQARCQFLQLSTNILVEMVFASLGSFQKQLDIRNPYLESEN